MRRRTLILTLVLPALVTVLSGQQHRSNQRPDSGTVSGKITQQFSAAAISAAVVNVPGVDAVTTDSDGVFILELSAGSHILNVTHPEYEPGQTTVEVTSDDTVCVEITLEDGFLFLDETVTSVSHAKSEVAEAAVVVRVAGSSTDIAAPVDPAMLFDKILPIFAY